MLDNVEVLFHSSVRINKGLIIYIDPYNISKNYNDADLIFITHSHYDHFSIEDIKKVMKKDTTIIVPEDLTNEVSSITDKYIIVRPNNKYSVLNISFETVKAYNINKPYHPKNKLWVGYIINIEGIKYYIAGDTDDIKENENIKCDVAFVPVGGTFTMDYVEASNFVNKIKPKYAVPIHYGSIVGSREDGINFVNRLDKEIKGIILLK